VACAVDDRRSQVLPFGDDCDSPLTTYCNGSFHHVVGTYDPTPNPTYGTFRLYIDWALVQTHVRSGTITLERSPRLA